MVSGVMKSESCFGVADSELCAFLIRSLAVG